MIGVRVLLENMETVGRAMIIKKRQAGYPIRAAAVELYQAASPRFLRLLYYSMAHNELRNP